MKKLTDVSLLSDEDILRERQELLSEYNRNLAQSSIISKRMARLKQELRVRRGKQEKPFVSDHAVIRYLERVEGLDIESIRSFLLDKTPIDAEVNEHNSIILNDFVLKLSKDRKAITTVITKDMLDEGSTKGQCPSSQKAKEEQK